MKTFKQFTEQAKNDVPNIIMSLQSISTKASKEINPEKVAAGVVGTVFDKLTGGEKGRENAINTAQKKVDKMSTDLPKAFDKFEKFLGSGKIEKSFNKANTKLNQVMK